MPNLYAQSIESLSFDHIGIVVADIEMGLTQLRNCIPLIARTVVFDDAVLGVSVCFVKDRTGVVFELISPFGTASPITSVLKKKVNQLNQIAYRCDDISEAGRLLREADALPLGNPKPAVAFGGALVQFFYSRLGFVIEIIEQANWQHSFKKI